MSRPIDGICNQPRLDCCRASVIGGDVVQLGVGSGDQGKTARNRLGAADLVLLGPLF